MTIEFFAFVLSPRGSLLALLAIGALHCKAPSPNPPAPTTASSTRPPASAASPTTPASPLPASAKSSTPATLATEYRGTIGGALVVVARLKREQNHVSGSYFYEKSGGAIRLDGSLTGTHLTLDEGPANAKSGSIEADLAPEGSLTGTWTDPSKKRSLQVQLGPILQEPSPASALLYKRTIHEKHAVVGAKSKDETCQSSVDYAEVFGVAPAAEAKINKLLAPSADTALPRTCDHAVETTQGYEVRHNGNGVLSLIVNVGVTDSQAAHPDGWSSPFDVWLDSGVEVKLLGDVVGSGDGPAIKRALAPVVHRLAHEAGADADAERVVLESFADPPAFVIDKQGLTLCVSPPHFVANLGGCQYPIPLSALPHVQDRAAAFWKK